jgi:hypothetical protein
MNHFAVTRIVPMAAALLAVLLVGGPEAHAQDASARCTFFEIEASNEGEPKVDPPLQPLKKKLEKPPFSSWKTFKVLGKHDNSLSRMKPEQLKLAIGGKLTALYRDLISAKGKKDRLRMTVTMDDKKGKRTLDTTFTVDSGDYILIGGQSLPSGATYILAISCK